MENEVLGIILASSSSNVARDKYQRLLVRRISVCLPLMPTQDNMLFSSLASLGIDFESIKEVQVKPCEM